MTTRTLAIVSGGLSQPSSTRLLADRLASATRDALALSGDDVVLEVVELREHARAIADNMLTGFPSPPLRDAVDMVTKADGLVVVTPTFNASYSGLFKSFFDVFEEGSLAGLPVLLGATGGSARHSLVIDHAMRPLFAYLAADAVPMGVFAATDDWGSTGKDQAIRSRGLRAGEQLARAVQTRRGQQQADSFGDVIPFAELLR